MKLLFEENENGTLKLIGRAYGNYETSKEERMIRESNEGEVLKVLNNNLSKDVDSIRGYEGYISLENGEIVFDESYEPKDSGDA